MKKNVARKSRSTRLMGLALALGVGIAAVPTVAHADITRPNQCSNGTQVVATYYSAGGGRSSEVLGDCGTMSVRVVYRTYSGSPLYYTAWIYNSSSAYRGSTGNIQVATHHNGTLMNGSSYASLP